jgi:hypothetical protein
MPKENDLEGRQDQGGKHGGQKGMPKSPDRPRYDDEGDDQGIVRPRGEEQPRDKERAPVTGRQGTVNQAVDGCAAKPAMGCTSANRQAMVGRWAGGPLSFL